jgi:hypothetical protein
MHPLHEQPDHAAALRREAGDPPRAQPIALAQQQSGCVMQMRSALESLRARSPETLRQVADDILAAASCSACPAPELSCDSCESRRQLAVLCLSIATLISPDERTAHDRR